MATFFAVGENSKFYKSIDDGDNWSVNELNIGNFFVIDDTGAQWRAMCVTPNGDVYACANNGDIYKQTGGAGDFVALGQTSRTWIGMCAAPNGDVYASVSGGDIYKQAGGAGNFVALGETSRLWRGMSAAPNGDVYVSVSSGDIYKQTGGAGNFVALGQTSRNWQGMSANANGDVYAVVINGDIYKQTGGSGNFLGLGQTSRNWQGICITPNGDVYASVSSGDIYKQTGGSGNFVALGQISASWRGMACNIYSLEEKIYANSSSAIYVRGYYTYSGVFFIDENIGWICGYDPSLSENNQPIIAKTIDGGNTWIQQTTPIIVFGIDYHQYQLLDILFVDANIGYCSGLIERDPSDANKFCSLLKTTDGGANWIEIPIIDPDALAGVAMIKHLVLDTDGSLLMFGSPSPNFFSYDYLMYVFRQDGVTQTCLNSWINTNNFSAYQASLINGKLRLAQATGFIGKSNDDGVSITETLIDATTNCRAVVFTDDNIGHLGTENGRIFRFNNSITPSEQTYNGNSILWLKMLNEINGIAVGANGEIYKYQV